MNTPTQFARLLIVLIAASSTVEAGTLQVFNLTGDGDSAVSVLKTYTHTIDLASDTGNTSINGVTFLVGGQGAQPGLNYALSFTDSTFNNHAPGVAGGTGTLINDFFYRASAEDEVLTLTNLTPQTTYRATFYVGGFAGHEQTLVVSDDNIGASRDVERGGTTLNTVATGAGTPGARITYDFVANGPRVAFHFQPINSLGNGVGSFHQYGFSNEVVTPGPAGRVYVTDLFNTGVDAQGVFIPRTGNANVDPNWDIDTPATGGLVFQDALIASNQGAYFNAGRGSQFVNELGDAAINSDVGTFTYRTTFTLAANLDPTSVILEGRYGVDNNLLDILVNGQSTGVSGAGFSSLINFSLTQDFFVNGVNTLDFVISNAGPNPNPSAFRVDGLFASAVVVPEPASIGLFSIGLCGLLAVRRRKRVS